MFESELQKEVSTAILTGKVGSLTLGVTDSENLVEVDIGEKSAVYTADEARQLAEKIRADGERNNVDNSGVVEYLEKMADVADDKRTAEEVRNK
jgi:hypothetical protein